ncbi:MAG: aldose epimerase family protein [Xanthobacteraceae bacterium]
MDRGTRFHADAPLLAAKNDSSALVEPFGETPDGQRAALYTLQNENIRVRITDYGGRIVSVEAPDRAGRQDHILLGFDSVADYVSAGGAFGALLGRNANRIAGGRFTLDGRTYELSKNEGDSTLQGGKVGFDKVFWRLAQFDSTKLVVTFVSPDGDQGFPGELAVQATYSLKDRALCLELEAQSTKATPVSLSAHPYFNLAGLSAGDVLDHEIMIAADCFLPTDAKQIPTGEIRPVDRTVFDFRKPMTVAARIRQAEPQLRYGKGYDHYFVLGKAYSGAPRFAARARDPQSGRVLEIFTTQPGTQFYTGNNLNGSVIGRGGAYRQSSGFAFEPQGFPDAPNQSTFPTTVLRPGAIYREAIEYHLMID